MCWQYLTNDGSLARNINFEVANLEVPKKTRRKTSILKLQSVKIGGSFARNARFDAPTCVSSRVSGFPVASPCLWGKLQNLSFSKVSKQVVISFCMVSVALTFSRVCKRVENRFMWKAQNFCVVFRRWIAFFVAGAALWRPPSSFCLAGCSTSNVSRCVLYTPHSTLYTLHFTLHTPHSTLYTLQFALHTLHSTLYTPLSTVYTLHSTLCTPPSSAFHSLQCTGTVTGEKCTGLSK